MVDWGRLGLACRSAFIFLNCAFRVYKSGEVSWRYFQTYDTVLQFEIWFMAACAVKVLLLMPQMLVFDNINYLFACFVINSAMMLASNYHLHSKCMAAVY